MTLTLAMPVDAKPTCADPQYRDMVDAAFEQAGGDASHWMRRWLCPTCPVSTECLLIANTLGEHGIWGGLNSGQRTRAGGRSASKNGSTPNLAGLHDDIRRTRHQTRPTR